MKIEIDNYHLISGNQILSMHWAERKNWKENLYKLIRFSSDYRWKVPEKRKYQVTITRISPRLIDFDNMITSCKYVIDLIKSVQRRKVGGKFIRFEDAGLIYEDSPNYLETKYLQIKGKNKVIIEVHGVGRVKE